MNSHRISRMEGCITTGLLLWLSACANANVLPAAIDASATAPALPTATIDWFPATNTPTAGPRPVQEATPDMKPGVGALLFTDSFSSPSLWNVATSSQASVAVDAHRLTIAVQPGVAPVVSFRTGEVFGDMYAEITARPSLCQGGDDYGVVFRAPNNVAYYRFALACNGTAGAERVSLSSVRVLQAPLASGDVPAGAPGEVRIGIWAVGQEFRFFLNDRYQFSATDRSYPSGGIGVFAQASGTSPVTVTFSDLAVYSVSYQPPMTPAAP